MLNSFQLRMMAGSLIVDGRADKAAQVVVPGHIDEFRAGSRKAERVAEITEMLEGMIQFLGLAETIAALREAARVK